MTVNILTKDSLSRLARLLAEVSQFADEILVGVDSASGDGTVQTAARHADVVYRFASADQLSSARMLPLLYASGDWILSLDDDESMEPSFDALLPSLLADCRPTHYWFPRKWVTSLDPAEYVHVSPWYPDWQLRLFRNDRSLVWKPHRPHAGYQVLGPGSFETRTTILHFEPLVCTPEARRDKVERYRRAGCVESGQRVFEPIPTGPRRPVCLRRDAPARPRPQPAVIHPEVHPYTASAHPPWGATVLAAAMPAVASVGEWFVAEVDVHNTGVLAWSPPDEGWPRLHLGTHVRGDDGQLVAWDWSRTPVPRWVAPGEHVTFICQLQAPDAQGRYFVEWDLVSEGECWFASCGSHVLRVPLEVR